ncbi:hypothetical protein M011DRAFT_463852 [Sporormia fimetaria CBS 119925]|uniref:Uncharacterized protein n=1 Tax=Sporormia fimetaria CBS 119925 TaxID=1340428 RepID=A0A6A6VPH4_9PLEO|nr:hypothetical protein M011DRAFT_463852 [Sporormia fimetaria CBS 119925]
MTTPTPTNPTELVVSATTPDTSTITSISTHPYLQPLKLFGWTATTSTYSLGTTGIWDELAFYHYVLYTSANYFDQCSLYNSDLKPGPLCSQSISYTACESGVLTDASTTSLCQPPVVPTHIDVDMYSCLTDYYYTTYGAQNPFSRVYCANREEQTGWKIYGASPTVPAPQPTYSGTYEPGSTLDTGTKAGIAVGAFFVFLSILFAVFLARKRKKMRKLQEGADEELLDLAGRGKDLGNEAPPRYEGGGASAAPPPYRP